ncbi:MAG: peptide-methionine (S)-S-oxide reductase MsrA [Tissierellia bacterium]|nr:peptide-methionine (S)-S-oxide reductase MsrA [Tissierellia bacterium]
MKTIYLAGGCFWGVDEYFSRLEGVMETTSGYGNSNRKNPSYEEVCSGKTNAVETVKVDYDPKKITLQEILKRFFSIIDPTLINRQGFDIGTQYRSGIYFTEKEDQEKIENFIESIRPRYSRIVTEVLPLENFYPAEEYHQDYLKKNPGGYCHIKLD